LRPASVNDKVPDAGVVAFKIHPYAADATNNGSHGTAVVGELWCGG